MRQTIIILLVVAIVGIGAFVLVNNTTTDDDFVTDPTPVLTETTTPDTDSDISNFEECVQAGNPVMESYPRQCSANGQTFVEDIGNENEKSDLIRIDEPRPNQTISSPLTLTGEARGTWYFEATFPVYLLDADENEITADL